MFFFVVYNGATTVFTTAVLLSSKSTIVEYFGESLVQLRGEMHP